MGWGKRIRSNSTADIERRFHKINYWEIRDKNTRLRRFG